MATEVTVRLSQVSKSFGETHALRSCDFEARAGEVHAIVGENGCGKSTLAKIMSGVLLPTSGTVSVFGRQLGDPVEARAAGVATIFQEILVADEASVYDNLYVGSDSLLRATAMRSERRARAQSLMDRLVGEPVDLEAPVGPLPLSSKQWIVIARALLRNPRLLILDESSAALDLNATLRLHAEILRLKEAGATILIVTHRIAELVRIADRATILRDGQNVGVLEKSDITEENLLAMMTPTDRKLTSSDVIARLPRRIGSQPLVTVQAGRLRAGSSIFDFSVEAGSVIGIAGLDGQGQDHFVRLLAGIRTAHAGVPTINVDGKAISISGLDAAERASVVYVSGDRKREGIFPQLSIYENLALGLYRIRTNQMGVIDRRGLDDVFLAEVDRLRIKIGSKSNRITSLSGGNQQKVLIGRAFAQKPRLIILNDPARGVDVGTKRDLYVELRRFAESGGAVIYLSSEIEEFINFADRVDVFVNDAIYRSLHGDAICEDEMLAAMFGQARDTDVSFEVLGVSR